MLKIEHLKKKFIINDKISFLLLQLASIYDEQNFYQKLKKSSPLIFVFFVLFILIFQSFWIILVIIFFLTALYLSKRSLDQKLINIIYNYNHKIKNEANYDPFYLIPENLNIKNLNIFHLNNYNIYMSNIKKLIDNGSTDYPNLHFVSLHKKDFQDDIYHRMKMLSPSLFEKKLFLSEGKLKDLAINDFFTVANQRFNLGENVLYFIDIFEKETNQIYIVIDTNPEYKIISEDLPIIQKNLLQYSFDFLDIRKKYKKEQNFENQKNEQNDISKQIEVLLREMYLTRLPDHKKGQSNHIKKRAKI